MIEFSKCLVLVVGDFGRSVAEPLALRALGARVAVAGLAPAAVKKQFEAAGIETPGIVRSRKRAAQSAVDWLGATDAVLFTAEDWQDEREEVLDAEREMAAADGRMLRPLLWKGDGRYTFLRSPAEWAAFTIARAARASLEEAKEFATRQARGYKDQDHYSGGGLARRRKIPRGGDSG